MIVCFKWYPHVIDDAVYPVCISALLEFSLAKLVHATVAVMVQLMFRVPAAFSGVAIQFSCKLRHLKLFFKPIEHYTVSPRRLQQAVAVAVAVAERKEQCCK